MPSTTRTECCDSRRRRSRSGKRTQKLSPRRQSLFAGSAASGAIASEFPGPAVSGAIASEVPRHWNICALCICQLRIFIRNVSYTNGKQVMKMSICMELYKLIQSYTKVKCNICPSTSRSEISKIKVRFARFIFFSHAVLYFAPTVVTF